MDLKAIGAMVKTMQEGAAYPPSTFGLYYEITTALMNEEETTTRTLIDELVQEQPFPTHEVKVIVLDDVSPPANRERYQRLMDTDPGTPFHIVSPPPEQADSAVQQFKSGMNRLRQAIPELADEFESLVREVLLVSGDKDLDYDFAGGSCYMLWGALFINAEKHADEIELIEAIAHESGHSLLFGFTIEEPLVMNDENAQYSSPLRDDPRPMDGIYHATYVSARMHWAMSKLLDSGQLSLDEIELAKSHREVDRRNFWNGYETVRSSGLLSDTGRMLMNNAHDYMKQFSGT